MWRTWVSWMDRREDVLPLALIRISVGLIIAAHLLHLVVVGAPEFIWLDADHGGLRNLSNPMIDWLGGASPATINRLVPATVGAALLMAAGAWTRVSTFATWLGFRLLADLNGHAGGSYDELLENTLFVLLLSGAGGRLSLDAVWGRPAAVAPAWPRYVLVVQLAWMYFSTVIQKVSSHWVPWGDLDALWYILQQPTWQRQAMTWLAPLYPLTQLATLASWLFEGLSPLLPLAVFFRATRTRPGRLRALLNRLDWRTRYLMVGLLLHLGIELTLEVGPFGFATVSLYLACFHADEWRALGRRASAWWRRATGRLSPAPLRG